MKHYRTVLFDIDDTIVDFKRSETLSLKNWYTCFFKQVISEDLFLKDYNRINHALWRQVEEGEMDVAALGYERSKKLADQYLLPFSPEIQHYYEQQLIKNAGFIDGAENLLDGLLSIGVKIGFITNGFSHIQRSKYKDLKLARYSDVLVISEEVGYSKPHPQIFHHTLERLQSNVADTLMVGDSITSDGEGARKINMSFCWYNPCKYQGPTHWEPDHIVHELKELISI